VAAKREIMPKKIGSVSKKQILPKKINSVSKRKTLPGKLTGDAAIAAYQKEISPRGMAKTKAAQTAALDKLMKQRYGKKK
jgi:hypothetical protein